MSATDSKKNDAPALALAVQRRHAAAMLGVSVDTFDRHIRPRLDAVHVGGVTLFRVSDLERWLRDHR